MTINLKIVCSKIDRGTNTFLWLGRKSEVDKVAKEVINMVVDIEVDSVVNNVHNV